MKNKVRFAKFVLKFMNEIDEKNSKKNEAKFVKRLIRFAD